MMRLLPSLFLLLASSATAAPTSVDDLVYAARLSPSGGDGGAGLARFVVDPTLRSAVVTIDHEGLKSPITALTLVVPESGEVLAQVSADRCERLEAALVCDLAHAEGPLVQRGRRGLGTLVELMEAGGVSASIGTKLRPDGALLGPVVSAISIHFAGCDTATMEGTTVHMAGCTTASL